MHNPRLENLPDYPFPRLNALLDGVAPGRPPLIMSVGEPQHAVPELLARTLAARVTEWGKYPPAAGTPEWRAAIASWLNRRYGLPQGMIDAERCLMPVSGTREALYMAGQAFIPEAKNGRKPVSIMPNPFYQVYLGSAAMSGAETVLLDAGRETGFLPDFANVTEETWDRAAVVTMCSPANPQGSVADIDLWKFLITMARERDFVLVADECYSEIYPDTPPTGALDACRELGGSLKNVLIFNSLSKRSSVPGLRSGFVVGDPDLVARFLRLRAYASAGVPLPVLAASAALWADEDHVAESRRLYREKMDDAERILGNRFGFTKPGGGFFLWLDVGDGEQAARQLWQDAGVKVLPGAYLAQPGTDGDNCAASYIWVALVHDRQTTAHALERLTEVL